MGIEHSQEDRLMAHAMPGDDPTWGEVSAFMEAVDSAYAEVPTTPYETAHLAAVFGAARSIHNGIPATRRKTMKDRFTNSSHRVLIASVAAALLALTAGVGAASALGGGPLANLLPAAPAEVSASEEATPTPTPTPTATETEDASDDQGEDEDEATPKPTATATHDDDSEKASKPTKSHDSEESDDKAEKSDDDGDDSEAEEPDDQGEDQEDASDSHGGSHEDDGDDDGHDDDSED